MNKKNIIIAGCLFMVYGEVVRGADAFLSALNTEAGKKSAAAAQEQQPVEKEENRVATKANPTIHDFLDSVDDMQQKKVVDQKKEETEKEKEKKAQQENVQKFSAGLARQEKAQQTEVKKSKQHNQYIIEAMKKGIVSYGKATAEEEQKKQARQKAQLGQFLSLMNNPLYNQAITILQDQTLHAQYNEAVSAISFSFDLYVTQEMNQFAASKAKELRDQASFFTKTLEHWHYKNPDQVSEQNIKSGADQFMHKVSSLYVPPKQQDMAKGAGSFIKQLVHVKKEEKDTVSDKQTASEFLSGLSKGKEEIKKQSSDSTANQSFLANLGAS